MVSEQAQQDKPTWVWILILLASAISLFVAFGHPSEYGFYTLARWVVTASAVVNLVLLLGRQPGLAVGNGVLALVFNPIIPLGLGREVWFVIDLVAVGVLVAGGYVLTLSNARDD